ncbi:MAG: PAS domain S-box protein [Methanomicrobiales archaeon]|nr:PAS domain S-box protein [Methanomicrobiales archaeon]
MIHLLFVDDESAILDITKIYLERNFGFQVETTESAPEGLLLLEGGSFDAVISDYEMPGMNGIDFLKEIRQRRMDLPFIIFTGRGRERVAIEAFENGADFYIQKGGDPKSQFTELAHKVRQAVEKRQAEKERAFLSNIAQQVLDSVVVIDSASRISYINEAAAVLFGYSVDELLGAEPACLVANEDRDRLSAGFQELLEAGRVWTRQFKGIKKDGTTFFAEIKLSPLYEAQGRLSSIVGVIRDISDRIRYEEELQAAYGQMQAAYEDAKASRDLLVRQNRELEESEGKFRALTESTPMAVLVYQDDRWVYANPAAEEISGYSEAELKSMYFWDFVESPYHDMIRQRGATRQKGDTTAYRYELQVRTKDGTERWIDLSSGFIELHGRPAGIVTAIDITDRKKADEELRKAKAWYQTIFETTSLPTAVVDENTRFIVVNNELAKLLALSKEELEGGKCWREFIVPEDLEMMLGYSAARRQDPASAPRNYEFRVRSGSGEIRHIYLTVALIPDSLMSVVSLLDITERKKAEDALRESEQMFRAISTAAHDAVIMTDREGRISMWNPAAERIFGYRPAEVFGRNVHSLLVPGEFEKAAAAGFEHFEMSGTGALIGSTVEMEAIRRNGERFPAELSISAVEIGGSRNSLAIVRDVTERKQAENAMKMANKKMHLLSEITRHDILNQITGLSGNIGLLKEILPEEPLMQKFLGNIEKTGKEIERKISFTRDYQSLGIRAPRWQRVDTVVRHAAAGLPAAITLTVSTGSLEIFADPMLEKVFFNFFDNSRRHGGRVSEVRVSSRADGDGVTIVYEDNGCGISAADKEKIFSQGFGKGTGLGLFLAKEILDITGIAIAENGEPGAGARFELRVPSKCHRAPERPD